MYTPRAYKAGQVLGSGNLYNPGTQLRSCSLSVRARLSQTHAIVLKVMFQHRRRHCLICQGGLWTGNQPGSSRGQRCILGVYCT